ncbi:MAG TPA: hypothetical protein VEO54_16605 [Thermoanaerobaculia bacterium]|nr:hypothetical protein [Thermoanaerobaculia bacterium]
MGASLVRAQPFVAVVHIGPESDRRLQVEHALDMLVAERGEAPQQHQNRWITLSLCAAWR